MVKPSSTQQNPDSGITPIFFEPLGSARKPRRRSIRFAAVAGAMLLAMCLMMLWFIFSARSLTVDTSPPETSVTISGGLAVQFGDRYLLRAGEYRLQAEAPGYHALQQDLTISSEASQRLTLELEKKPGQLALVTVPEGARILLDNSDRGQTPQTLTDIAAGNYSLQLNHPRYQPWQQDISIQGMDITERIEARLEPAWGLIALASTPAGAEVTVGDQLVGKTPLSVQVQAAGETVSVKLQGYKRWEKVLHGRIGETLSHDPIVLAPADGLANVRSTPPGATVTVNGDYKGRTPLMATTAKSAS